MSKLIDQSPAVVQAIHEVFHQSEPCHCTGPGKLSEGEVLEALVRLRHVAVPDVRQQDLLPIRALFRSEGASTLAVWDLEQAGVKSLTQLEAWTFADILRLRNVGRVKAVQIEALMAKYGLALKDGDPARYQHLLDDEPIAECPVADLPPDEMRRHCAAELISTGQRLIHNGTTLINSAVRVTNRVKQGGYLKNTIKVGGQIVRQAEGTVNLLHSLEQREATVRRLAKPGPRVPTEARQQGNVVTGAFAAAGGCKRLNSWGTWKGRSL